MDNAAPADCWAPYGPSMDNEQQVSGVDWSRWALIVALVQMVVDLVGLLR